MINVTVNGTEQIKCNKGDNLYQVLTAAGYVFAGNCGMKGRCNRCLVWNQDTGSFVKSCQYIVDRDISIRLEEEQLTGITGHKMNLPTEQRKKPVTSAYGIAIDIGTTTIGMELVDLNEKAVKCSFSTLNSQIATGADVVARIQAADTKEGLKHLRSLLFSDIQKGVDHMLINTQDSSYTSPYKITSAPYDLVRFTLIRGVDDGITIVAFTPYAFAAYATPCA